MLASGDKYVEAKWRPRGNIAGRQMQRRTTGASAETHMLTGIPRSMHVRRVDPYICLVGWRTCNISVESFPGRKKCDHATQRYNYDTTSY